MKMKLQRLPIALQGIVLGAIWFFACYSIHAV